MSAELEWMASWQCYMICMHSRRAHGRLVVDESTFGRYSRCSCRDGSSSESDSEGIGDGAGAGDLSTSGDFIGKYVVQ